MPDTFQDVSLATSYHTVWLQVRSIISCFVSVLCRLYSYSTLDDEHFQLLDAYICISSHYRQLYSRHILCGCLKQPHHFNNSPFNYIAHVDGSFVNRFPFLPGTCCCSSVYNSFQLKMSL